MRVMVLAPAQLYILLVQGSFGGQVLGMEVVRADLGPHVEQPLEVRDCFRKRPECRKILQVANVVGEERIASLGHTDSILQLGTAGQHRL